MLAGDFFDIQSFTVSEPGMVPFRISSVARLNPQHPIFAGHFPGNPVVPGVCQVQMVKELVERSLQRKLKLTASDNIKFLSMISPDASPLLEFDIQVRVLSGRQISATAAISSGAQVFLKFKGEFDTED
jgi:3-hydroxyacyl-[acyl-carrier-protein] dehydratase